MVHVLRVLSLKDRSHSPEPYRVVCYFASWSNYRDGNGAFNISYIVPDHCTHLVYTFAGLNIDGGVDSLDYFNDINVNSKGASSGV